MRFSKLYIKIFLSFVAVLVVAEILIFGLFMVTVGRPIKERVHQYTAAKASLLRTVVEQRLLSSPGRNGEDPSLERFVTDFARILEARIWLTEESGRVVTQSFPEAVPAEAIERLRHEDTAEGYGDIRIHSRRRHDSGIYVTVPVDFRHGDTGTLHLLFDGYGPPHPEGGFALGLLVIGAVIALLVVPVSRFVTKRVKHLQESALRIAEGDLAHRAHVQGKDELGELGRAFNTMAAKLEQMVQGTRELTANVSHELRSPLARIRVALELLRDRMEKGEVKGTLDRLEGIREEIEILDRLIGRILALSRMDFQSAPFQPEETDLTRIVQGLTDRFRPAMEERGLRVCENLRKTPLLAGDAKALKTAVTNLLDNALRYTPAGGDIWIELATYPGWVALTVTNTCDPLPAQELKRLFEPFHRAGPDRSSGSGLGLAITKRIVDQHGGDIEAQHMEGRLSFRMTLPLTGSSGPDPADTR